MTPKARGVLYIIASTSCLSATFIASKQAMAELTPLAFAPVWFAIASGWGLGYYKLQKERIAWHDLKPRWGALLALGLTNSASNYFFFSAIRLGDPTVVAFFGRSAPLFAVLIGVILLRERLTGLQWLGGLVTIVGAGLMTYQGGSVVWTVLSLTLISNFFNALSAYFAKRNTLHIPAAVMGIARTLILTVSLGLLSLFAGELTWPSLHALAWMIGGSFFGPFLSYILFFRGLRTIDLSQATIIQASQPLFVAFYSFLLFGSLIGLAQFAGGLVVLSGILMILLPNSRFSRRRNISAEPEFRPTISPAIQPDRSAELPGHQE